MTIARTDATGRGELDADVLAFTTSLPIDQVLYGADIAGSLAHVRMLEEVGLIPAPEASAIRSGLRAIYDEARAGTLKWANEVIDAT